MDDAGRRERSVRITGKLLNERWGVGARQALYRKTGDWYHQLTTFPGALFDDCGYVLFPTEQEYRDCPQLQAQQDLHVPDGIASLPRYIRFTDLEPTEGDKAPGDRREGRMREVLLTRYERDPVARARCLAHWGFACSICSFDFGSTYGAAGAGLIHVHHHTPLATHGREHQVDPVRDLCPVCPNCHALIHRRDPPYTTSEVRDMIRPAKASTPHR